MKVSIITVTYNSEETLRDTIESVLSQSYTNIEYIIIDGASKDKTVDIIKSYEPKFNGRMLWISEKDNGIYDAMNKGIFMSTGDIVGLLNSDDFFTNKFVVERFMDSFKDISIDGVYGDIHFVDSHNLKKEVRHYSSRIFRPWLLRFGFMPAHPSFYCRKSCYEKYGGYALNYKIAADFDLLIRFLYKEKISTKYLAMDFVTMRTGGVSTENFSSRILLNKEIVSACKKYNIYTNLFFLCLKYVYKIFELNITK